MFFADRLQMIEICNLEASYAQESAGLHVYSVSIRSTVHRDETCVRLDLDGIGPMVLIWSRALHCC